MKTFTRQVVSSAASVALLLQTLAPALAMAAEPRPSRAPKIAVKRWSRHLFNHDTGSAPSREAAAPLLSGTPPLSPRPGGPLPWQPKFNVHGGKVNLATGNVSLSHSVTGWSAIGPGVKLDLHFNSQSSSSSVLGPKWNHDYQISVSGTSPAVVNSPDGTQTAFTLGSSGYTAPAGIDQTLERLGDGTWKLTFKDGSRWLFDSSGRLTSIKDSNDNATTLVYAGSVLSQIKDSANRAMVLSYTAGKLTGISDYRGRTWSLSYNAAGRLSSLEDPTLNGQVYVTSFAYDSNDNVTGETDRLGNAWHFAYGPNNTFYTTTDPSGKTAGQAIATMPAEDTNQFSSSQSATPVSPTDPDSNPTTYPVDTVATTYLEDASGTAVEYGLNAQGRITAVRDGTGAQANYSYDASNRLVQLIKPGNLTTSYSYDARGNTLTMTDASGRTITNTYDARNNALTSSDNAGHQEVSTYDARNNILTLKNATNNTTSFAYNAQGQVTSVTDPAGNSSQFAYDTYGNQTSETDALGNTESRGYSQGRMDTRTDALGRITYYTYDSWDRLVAVDYPQSTDQSFVYDAEGRLTQSVDGTGTRTYTYDSRGRKTAQTDPRGNTNATYDDANRLTSQTDVTGRLVQYQYDGAGRLAQVSDPTSWSTFTYDAAGRKQTATTSNGIKSVYAYDGAGRVTGLTHRRVSNNSVVLSYASTYNAAGLLDQVTESVGGTTTSYTYDNENRLLTEQGTGSSPYQSSYTYNSRGLRVTATRSEGGVASHNGTYTYDADGRLTAISDTVAGSSVGGNYVWNADDTLASYPGPGYTRKLSYDEEGRLTSIKKDFGNGNVQVAYDYAYGYDGNRRWKKDYAANTWEWYPCGVACDAGELAELQSTLSGSSWSVKSTNLVGDTIVRSGAEFQLASSTGDIAAVSNSSGSVVGTQAVDTFGKVRSSNTSSAWLSPSLRRSDETLSVAKGGHVLLSGAGVTSKGAAIMAMFGKPDGWRDFLKWPKGAKGWGKSIGKGAGIATGIANGICGAALLALADDIQNAPGQPLCSDVCKAIAIWEEQIRNSGVITGVANFFGCGAIITVTKLGCSCKS